MGDEQQGIFGGGGNLNAWLQILIQILTAISTMPREQQDAIAARMPQIGTLQELPQQYTQQTDPHNPNAGVGQST